MTHPPAASGAPSSAAFPPSPLAGRRAAPPGIPAPRLVLITLLFLAGGFVLGLAGVLARLGVALCRSGLRRLQTALKAQRPNVTERNPEPRRPPTQVVTITTTEAAAAWPLEKYGGH